MSPLPQSSGTAVDAAIGLPSNLAHFEALEQQQQLFRYAQDLQELMTSQDRLLRRHETVLQFLGRGEPHADLLLNSLLQATRRYLVTDHEGLIMKASADAATALSPLGRSLHFLPLQQLLSYSERDRVKGIIQGFADAGASGAIHQHRLFLWAGDPAMEGQGHEVLVMMVGLEIYWLLGQVVKASAGAVDLEQAFPHFGDAQVALMITDADANIRAVSPAFTRVTGYSAAEVMGHNPRMLSSGLQDPPFYRQLWEQLQQDGSWTGELFNRRKDGQIYFEWATFKAVRNSLGQTRSYIAAFADLSKSADDKPQVSPLVYHDLLTGLANRRLLEVQLMHCLTDANRDNNKVGVLWVGLERFDELARELGHEQGEQLLQASGQRVQQRLPAGSTVTRVSAGEFLVLLANNPDQVEIERAIQVLRAACTEPFRLARGQVSITTVSVGSASYPKDGTQVDELLRIAKSEMHYQSPIMAWAIERPDVRWPPALRLHPDLQVVTSSKSVSEQHHGQDPHR